MFTTDFFFSVQTKGSEYLPFIFFVFLSLVMKKRKQGGSKERRKRKGMVGRERGQREWKKISIWITALWEKWIDTSFLIYENISLFCSSIFYLIIHLYEHNKIFQIFTSGSVTFLVYIVFLLLFYGKSFQTQC